VTKKKEAQKLAAWSLSKITEITSKPSKQKSKSKSPSKNESDDIAALEAAFGSLDAKLN
jgi:hypothetical protein